MSIFNAAYGKCSMSRPKVAASTCNLTSVYEIENLYKFNIQFGTQWASTGWYKDASGEFQQIPLLTATRSLLYYQDGTDPEIFGRIKIIDQDLADTLDIEDILGKKLHKSQWCGVYQWTQGHIHRQCCSGQLSKQQLLCGRCRYSH
jgi:hypothetical protein